MFNKEIKLPLYAKTTIFLVGLFALFTILYIAQDIIIPIVFSIIIAVLLNPIVNFFVKIKINRVLAIIITIFLTFIVIVALIALLYSQAIKFGDSWPILVSKFTEIINQSITWVSGYFEINPIKIHEWITKTKVELINMNSASIGQTLLSVGNSIMVFLLVPVYILIILYYKPLFLDFIHKVFITSNQTQVSEIVTQTKSVIQRYLFGLVIEAIIVATLNSVGLLVLGIEYAILLGVIGAMLNVIPYIGGIVAVALPMMVALSTKSPIFMIYILALYIIVQLIDNNYIIPKVVASKVKINAFFSIIVVIAGGSLWGISGMFLSIPLLAIVKLIFDHIEPLKPWGFLLGDTMPSILSIKTKKKRPQ